MTGLRMGREKAHAHRTGKARTRRRLRQAMHPHWPPQTHLRAEDAACQPVKARDLAGRAGQNDLLAGHVVEPGGIEAGAHLLEDLLDAGAHDADQLGSAHLAAIVVPVAGVAGDLDHLAVVHAGGVNAAIEGLDPLGHRHGDRQTHGDVAGDMVAAHGHGVGVDHVLFHEDRHACGAAPHVDAGSAQLLLVLDQRGNSAHVGGRRKPCKFQIAFRFG